VDLRITSIRVRVSGDEVMALAVTSVGAGFRAKRQKRNQLFQSCAGRGNGPCHDGCAGDGRNPHGRDVDRIRRQSNLRAARPSLRATDENVAIAMSGWRPSIVLNGNVTKEHVATSTPAGSGANIGVSGQPIPVLQGVQTLTQETVTGTIPSRSSGASRPSPVSHRRKTKFIATRHAYRRRKARCCCRSRPPI